MKTVLVTTTFYDSLEDVRFQCALKTVQEAQRRECPIIVIDDSPILDVRREFARYEGIVFQGPASGMGPSRREALLKGLNIGAQVIDWIEPEKYSMVPLLNSCNEMVLSGEYDIATPRRRTLTGYPFYQHWSELEANWRLGEITGRPDLDLMVGPRCYSRRAVELTLRYDGTLYGDNWEIIFIPILWALNSGMNVGSRTVDYIHPPEQSAIEQGEAWDRKRDKQRIDLVTTMAREAKRIGYKSPLT